MYGRIYMDIYIYIWIYIYVIYRGRHAASHARQADCVFAGRRDYIDIYGYIDMDI